MSDSTTQNNNKPVVESNDPFERELQKKIRNKNKKLDKIHELEKKVKKKEIVANDEQKEKIESKQGLVAEIAEVQAYLDLFKLSQKQTEQAAKETKKAHHKEIQQSKQQAVTAVADMLTILALRE